MMKLIYTTVFLLMSTMTSTELFAQNADALVKRVRDKLNTVKDYEADGVLVTNVSFMKVPESPITVYYKNPDKFKIKKKDGISVVPKGGMSVNMNSLFAGSGEYTAVPSGTVTDNGQQLTVVKLLPLAEGSDVVVSTLYIDEKNALVKKAITTTRESGTYEIELSYGRFAQWGLPDKVVFLFNTQNYKLPKGLAFDYDTGEKPVYNDNTVPQKGRVEISYKTYRVNKGIPASVFAG